MDRDIERIKEIIAEKNKRYQHRGGEVVLAGIDGGSVKIAPAGFCWK
jgi:pyrimidine operon attenuation protein/uracil phosphoribosyltransferase